MLDLSKRPIFILKTFSKHSPPSIEEYYNVSSHGNPAVTVVIIFLAVIFTIALTFASVEFPALIDSYLHNNIHYPDIVTGQDDGSANKTELYLDHFNYRLIGYLCLGLIATLIINGFVTEKSCRAAY